MLPISNFKTRTPLDTFSLRYANDQSGYAAQKIFTPHPVPKAQGSFYAYTKDSLRVENTAAPRGTEARSGEHNVFTSDYSCVERRWKGLVLEKDARDADRPVADLNQDQAATNMDKLLIDLEVAAYTKVSTTTNYPSALVTALTGSDVWTDASADIVAQVRDLGETIFTNCGKRPNALCISGKQLRLLKTHPGIIDRLKYTQKEVSDADLAMLLGVKEIIVSDVAKNTGTEGASDTIANVWGSTAGLIYKDPATRLRTMTYGKMFIVQQFYTKRLDKPEVGAGMAAWELESGWEWCLEFAAQVSDSDGDAVAGGILTGTHS